MCLLVRLGCLFLYSPNNEQTEWFSWWWFIPLLIFLVAISFRYRRWRYFVFGKPLTFYVCNYKKSGSVSISKETNIEMLLYLGLSKQVKEIPWNEQMAIGSKFYIPRNSDVTVRLVDSNGQICGKVTVDPMDTSEAFLCRDDKNDDKGTEKNGQ